MNTTNTTETRTTVRHPAQLIITGYSVQACDPYGKPNRETLEIVGDGGQIVTALVDWIALRDRDAKSGSKFAAEDLQRLAGAMGLDYVATTSEG
jgi:hypothetical protein